MCMTSLSCRKWDLVAWPKIKPGPPALGAWSLSLWATWEVPASYNFIYTYSLCISKRQKTHFNIIAPTFEINNSTASMWSCFREQMKNADLWRQAKYPHGHRDVKLSFPHCGSTGHASRLAVKTSESGWWDLTVNIIVVICLFCISGWGLTGWNPSERKMRKPAFSWVIPFGQGESLCNQSLSWCLACLSSPHTAREYEWAL